VEDGRVDADENVVSNFEGITDSAMTDDDVIADSTSAMGGMAGDPEWITQLSSLRYSCRWFIYRGHP